MTLAEANQNLDSENGERYAGNELCYVSHVLLSTLPSTTSQRVRARYTTTDIDVRCNKASFHPSVRLHKDTSMQASVSLCLSLTGRLLSGCQTQAQRLSMTF